MEAYRNMNYVTEEKINFHCFHIIIKCNISTFKTNRFIILLQITADPTVTSSTYTLQFSLSEHKEWEVSLALHMGLQFLWSSRLTQTKLEL